MGRFGGPILDECHVHVIAPCSGGYRTLQDASVIRTFATFQAEADPVYRT